MGEWEHNVGEWEHDVSKREHHVGEWQHHEGEWEDARALQSKDCMQSECSASAQRAGKGILLLAPPSLPPSLPTAPVSFQTYTLQMRF